MAGFKHLAPIEREPFAAETLRSNSRTALHIDPDRILHVDAKDVDYQPYLGRVDLLAAGPPCQPFSHAGDGRGPADARNMFPLLLNVIPKVRPRAVLVENVVGLTRDKFKEY